VRCSLLFWTSERSFAKSYEASRNRLGHQWSRVDSIVKFDFIEKLLFGAYFKSWVLLYLRFMNWRQAIFKNRVILEMLWKALKGFCLPPRVLLGLSFSSSLDSVEKQLTLDLFAASYTLENVVTSQFLACLLCRTRLSLIWSYEPISAVLKGQGSFSLKTESSHCPLLHHQLYVLDYLYRLLLYEKTFFLCSWLGCNRITA